jgi:hypothetical protein
MTSARIDSCRFIAAILFEILCESGDTLRQAAGSDNCIRVVFHRDQSERLSQNRERPDYQVALSLP